MLAKTFNADSKNVELKGSEIYSSFTYETSKVVSNEKGITKVPTQKKLM